jgi:preprotein translocase subunit SecE
MTKQAKSSSSRSGGSAAVVDSGRPAPKDRKKEPSKVTDKPLDRPAGVPRSEHRSFFEVYKRGQGYYTRVGTAVGGGALILAGGNFLFDQLKIFDTDASWALWVQVGVPVIVIVLLGLLLYWVVGVNRKSCDFMIATEGEMKKVSWSSRRELIGSTKVVIMFTILIAVLLFVTDIVFMLLFGAINVLKVAPSVLKLFTGE